MNTFIRQCQEALMKKRIPDSTLQPAVFFDRDGTLIEERHYLQDISELLLFPDTIACLQKLNRANLPLYIFTNQAGIAHGYFTETHLQAVHHELLRRLSEAGVAIRGIFYCPHHPEAETSAYRRNCFGRKPSPGLLYQAACQERLNLTRSYVIGDKLSDISAGKISGAKTALVLTGHGPTEAAGISPTTRPDMIGANLTAVTEWLLANHNQAITVVK